MLRSGAFLNKPLIAIPLCVLAGCTFSLVNGYPILYSDTATYISSGFEFQTPFDRPITYGILLRLFSLWGISFRFVPVFQVLLLLFVLYKILILFNGKENVYSNLVLLTLVLLFSTGFFWSVNELIPDFLAPIGLLAFTCILLRDRTPVKEIAMFVIFFICAASHISNTFVYLLILIGALTFRNYLPVQQEKKYITYKLAIAFILLVISYLIMTSAVSKSKDVFMAGSMAQKGILQKVLQDRCPDTSLRLCTYRDSIPESFEYFVWKTESPLYKLGGWKEMRKELKTIIGISFSEPEYLGMHLKKTALHFAGQVFMFDVAEGNGPFNDETILVQRIKKYGLLDDSSCTNSMQSAGKLAEINGLNYFYRITTVVIVVLCFYLFAFRFRQMDPGLRFLFILTLTAIFLTSLMVAFSSDISHRHGCKLYWLFAVICFVSRGVVSRSAVPTEKKGE